MAYISQPKSVLPDLTDDSLQLSVLNKSVNDWKDYSVNGYDLTQNGTVIPQANGIGYFNGTTGYLRRAIAGFRSTDETGTIEAWIKLDSIGSQRTIFGSCDEGDDVNKLLFWIRTTGAVGVQSESGGGGHNNIYGDTILVAGVWYYVGVTSSGSAYKIYVNGEAEDLTINSGHNNGHWLADAADRDSITVGCRSKDGAQDYFFNGNIAMLNYYSEEKTDSFMKFRYISSIPEG